MPNSLLLLLLLLFPPAYTMCYAAGTAPHTGPNNHPRYTTSSTECEPAARTHDIIGEADTLRIILLGAGGTCLAEHNLYQFKQLGLDHHRAIQLACKLHAKPVMCANKLATTRCVIKTMILATASITVKGTRCSSEPMCPFKFFLN
eukprot:507807-Pelagomonas_calceolata.AAC.1